MTLTPWGGEACCSWARGRGKFVAVNLLSGRLSSGYPLPSFLILIHNEDSSSSSSSSPSCQQNRHCPSIPYCFLCVSAGRGHEPALRRCSFTLVIMIIVALLHLDLRQPCSSEKFFLGPRSDNSTSGGSNFDHFCCLLVYGQRIGLYNLRPICSMLISQGQEAALAAWFFC